MRTRSWCRRTISSRAASAEASSSWTVGIVNLSPARSRGQVLDDCSRQCTRGARDEGRLAGGSAVVLVLRAELLDALAHLRLLGRGAFGGLDDGVCVVDQQAQ